MTRRAVPLLLLLVSGLGLLAVVVSSTGGGSPERNVARRFLDAWRQTDYEAMHALLTPGAQRTYPLATFQSAYRTAAATATVRSLDPGEVDDAGAGAVRAPVVVRTRIFGTLRLTARLTVGRGGPEPRIAWGPELAFPEVRTGDDLTRRTFLPKRAAILAHDGTPLASGPERSSPLGPAASAVTGHIGAVTVERAPALRALGHPDDAFVGTSGLELVLEDRLAGAPGGELRIGGRVVARALARRAPDVRTTIVPRVQRAVVEALGGRFGGIIVLRPRTGEILGLAGVPLSAAQPPGSTFKIITAVAALEAGLVKASTAFGIETSTTLEGVEISNADHEACGGTFAQAFAHSCNSVFAPLGARLGAERLVDAAERFGFNEPPPILGAVPNTIPRADELGDRLAVGSSAIGQGRVQATALGMASVAAAIAMRGRRARASILPVERPRYTRAATSRAARSVGRMMVDVVRFGTAAAAAIPGVVVAGKTGTAELVDAPRPAEGVDARQPPPEPPDTATDTDAWFVGYAPASRPRVAVGVMLVRAGKGGEVAAPLARQVMLAALGKSG